MGEDATKSDDQKDETTAADTDTVSSATTEADDAAHSDAGENAAMDTEIAQAMIQKKLALIQAWEENEKIKAANKAFVAFRALEAREKAKTAALEADLMEIEEKFERVRAGYVERMKEKLGMLQKEAKEKRAKIEVDERDEVIKIVERAGKYRLMKDGKPKRSCICSCHCC